MCSLLHSLDNKGGIFIAKKQGLINHRIIFLLYNHYGINQGTAFFANSIMAFRESMRCYCFSLVHLFGFRWDNIFLFNEIIYEYDITQVNQRKVNICECIQCEKKNWHMEKHMWVCLKGFSLFEMDLEYWFNELLKINIEPLCLENINRCWKRLLKNMEFKSWELYLN